MFSNIVIVNMVALSVPGIDVLAVMFVGILLLLVVFVRMFVTTFTGMTKPWFGGMWDHHLLAGCVHHCEHHSHHVFLMFTLCLVSVHGSVKASHKCIYIYSLHDT